jgi:hypothetical protein
MKRMLIAALLVASPFVAASGVAAPSKEKEALQALNEFIGAWKGNGAPVKGGKPTDLWTEKVSWGWKIKGDDVALSLTFTDGKYFKSGEMRYIVADKKYKLVLKDANDKELVYQGEMSKDGLLELERKDEDKKITQKLTMNTAVDGDRLIYGTKNKKDGTTVWVADYEVAFTREGATIGKKEKKIECVVSGGLGTIPVTYKGETFYVCCSGCKEAFNENPEKYIKEYRERKKNKE